MAHGALLGGGCTTMKLATFRYMNEAQPKPFPDLASGRMICAFATRPVLGELA